MTEDLTLREKAEAYQAEQLSRAWASMLATEAGRWVVWSILQPLHLFETTHTGNSNGAFLEGQRHVGLRIIESFIKPQGISTLGQMMTEAEARDEAIARAELADHKEETADE